ncbi:MAG: homoserine kinase [Candidatus Rokuibacteriota bacterium]
MTVPATSANCGPGFDALGLALELYNEVELTEADGLDVDINGEGASRLPRDGQNIVVRGVRLVYDAAGRPFRGLRIRQRNRIPPSRGLGSSASAWLGGMLGANALLGGPLSREAVMELAVQQEGHPDNLGAALYGSLAVTCWDGEARVVVTLPVSPDLRFAVLVPSQEASTAEARAALPASYSRADAAFNVGRTALLVAVLARERWDDLGLAMADRLHQPYRSRVLFPWLSEVFAAARAAGALGVALSGAGPSVLAVARRAEADSVARAMREALGSGGVGLVLAADRQGARVEEFSD